jgi:DNA helicase-2/ATP-dependent DNA helicase PcrA
VQIARRRKLDMVAALAAALESPQLVPEARERITSFLTIQRAAAAVFDDQRADLFVYRLIEQLGLRRHQLFSAEADVVERLVNLAKLAELAGRHSRVQPQATPRDFAAYITVVADSGIGEAEAVAAEAQRAVVIASIDDIGGLEFDHVFVLSLGTPRTAGASDEARLRRLLYVAMTRARESLVLSYVAGDASPGAPPPFAEQARVALGGRGAALAVSRAARRAA